MSTTAARWGDEIAVEVHGGVPYRMYTERPRRVESVLQLARRWGTRPHIILGERVFSFDDMRGAVDAKVAELKACGVKRGDRIFLVGWNGPEWVVNFWACLCAGAIPVLANTWWSAAEMASGLAALEPALTLADSSAAAKMPAGARCGPWALATITSATTASAPPREEDPGSEDETAVIIFTSGTSGQPKAVVLSHRAVLARLHMTLQVTRKLPHQVDESAHDVALITGPLFHVGQMHTLLRGVIVGDTLVVSGGRYDPAEVLELIERHRINRWTAVPTMVSRLLDHPDIARRDVSSLKSISIGGAPVHAELMQRMRSALPSVSPRVPTGYGLTENGGQATGSAGSENVELLGSTGKPMPLVEVSFLAHEGLPDGEILLRAPTQMSGYWGIAESPIDAQGWLHTGDLGRLDERGNLWITGRSKDMIIRGGENIAPAAVERALMNIEGVDEAVVFGVPHTDLGEEVMAVVVVNGSLTAEQLREQLKGRVASFAIPSRWKLQKEALPTNPAGKVDKPAISLQARTELQETRAPKAG
jgi:acyl-CoA synthetase (AMP-forming)/AMP-acid ligase II